jgi:hypothetical protein
LNDGQFSLDNRTPGEKSLRPFMDSTSRRNFLQTLTAGSVLGAALPAAAAGPGGEHGAVLNVRDFGAVGDGKADDTAAFHNALAAASKFHSGRTVLVPGGAYRLTAPLTVRNQLLLGQAAGGWPADSRPLPGLLPDMPSTEACVIADSGASLHGLSFAFVSKTDPNRDYGPGVVVKGNGVSLTNLTFHNPTEGIMWDGVSNIGRLNIENVFIVNAKKCGVSVAHTMDVSTLRNIEVWNYESGMVNTSTGFRLGQNDEIRLAHCAVVSAAIGFHFIETLHPDGRLAGTWGGMDNCSVDSSAVAIRIDAANSLRIHGGSLWAHSHGVELTGRGHVVLTGMDIRANGGHGLLVKDCDSLTVSGCLFKKNGPNWPNAAKVQLEGGRSTVITGCTFDETSLGINIAATANNFSITGNSFAKMPHPAIVDHSGPGTRKLMMANLAG